MSRPIGSLSVPPGAALALAAALPLAAQGRVPVDPYTSGDAAAMQAAGYVSFGPFPFGEGHTTRDVEALLGDEPLHWVETAHFRLGCAASPLTIRRADPEWAKSVKQELERLRVKLPTVKKNVRELDPWLRTHLIAQRLEDLYAAIQQDLGVTDADFPAAPMSPSTAPEEYRGAGPYLGMPAKFSVLIVRRGASCARYTRAYGGRETMDPLRLNFPGYGGLGLCLAEETNKRLLENDLALHTHLAYNVVANLLNGYRSYGHDLPPWLLLGLAHWHSRRVCPRFPAYERKIEDPREDSPFWQWEQRAVGLMRNEAFEPLEDLMRRADITQFDMEQHIQTWFFVDWLMQEKRAQTMRFLDAMKDPFHQKKRLPDHDEVLDRQWVRFEQALGDDPAAIEAEWQKYGRALGRRE